MIMDAAAPAATDLKLHTLLDAGVAAAVAVGRAAGRVTSLSLSSFERPFGHAPATTLLALLAGRLQTLDLITQDPWETEGLAVLACCRELRSLTFMDLWSTTRGKQDCPARGRCPSQCAARTFKEAGHA